MKFHETKCKICGGRATAKWDDEAPQEAVDGFLPMLTCNPCYDRRLKRQKATRAIYEACGRLERSSTPDKIRSEVRQALTIAVPAYAEATAEHYRVSSIPSPIEMVEVFIERPELCDHLLKEFTKRIQRGQEYQPEAA